MFISLKIHHFVLHICEVYTGLILNVFCCDLLYLFSIIVLGFLDVMSYKSFVFHCWVPLHCNIRHNQLQSAGDGYLGCSRFLLLQTGCYDYSVHSSQCESFTKVNIKGITEWWGRWSSTLLMMSNWFLKWMHYTKPELDPVLNEHPG